MPVLPGRRRCERGAVVAAVLAFDDWVKPPLSLNDRPKHWAARGKHVAEVRELAADLCRDAIAAGRLDVLEPIVVTLVWYAPTRAARDADNPVATLKPVCDGLVDAGLVPDDTPEWMDKRPVQIVYRKNEPGVELHVETAADVELRVARAILALNDERGGDVLDGGVYDQQANALALARVALDAARFASLPIGV